MQTKSFQIEVAQETLDDLQRRLAGMRWPDEPQGAGWQYGTNLGFMQQLADYWQNHYDWRAQEAMLNQFEQFRADFDGVKIHYIYARGKGSNPTPLILTHGWPDSFYRMIKIIPMLTDPARFGGDPGESFDVVVPSIPGFGFSDAPRGSDNPLLLAADLWPRLMSEVLGYDRFVAAGGDFGSTVSRLIGIKHPDQLLGLHLTDIGYAGDPAFTPDLSNLSQAEQGYLGATQGWFYQEGAYTMIQSSKPQTLAYGLSDSPVGMAAWLLEKWQTWTDKDGDIEQHFSKDDLLNNVMIYWVTNTFNSSIRTYYANARTQALLQPGQHIEVPAAVARFPKDIPGMTLPRELAERSLRVARWTEMPRGGHFAALEEPALLAEDMRAFVRDLKAKG